MIFLAVLSDIPAYPQTDPLSQDREYLSENYYSAGASFDRGDFIEALQQYGDEIRRTVQNGRRHWVDSICYHAKVGECHYQMGDIDSALACFEIALQDYLDNHEWPAWLHFDAVPDIPSKAKSLPPWGDRSLLSGKLALIPNRVLIDFMLPDREESGDPQVRYAVAPNSEPKPIDPTEVVACLATALNRRAELLGPLGAYDDLNDKLVRCLRRNPFPDDHWSSVYGDLLLGMALATAGNDREAKPLLERNLPLENADHPLTGFAQLDLGKIALRAGDDSAAHRHFVAASHSGWHYANPFVLGEAFRHVAMTQKMTAAETPFLNKALEWSERERLPGLQILLHTLLAEDFVFRKDFASAKNQLKRARALADKHDIQHGRLAGNWGYLDAIDAYNANNTAAGDQALAMSWERVRGPSPRDFQLALLEKMFDSGTISVSGAISPRMASNLYEKLLREPTEWERRTRPAESLAAVLAPRHAAYDQWFALAVAQRDVAKAFEIAELTKRHRFQSTLPWGDRLLSLRFLLEAPVPFLRQEHVEQRLQLFAERPELKQVSDAIRRVHGQIASQPFLATDTATQRRVDALYRELETLATQQEAMLHRMVLEGVATPNLFPPVFSCEEYRRQLPEGTVTLLYFATMGKMYGFLISRDRCDMWLVPNAQQLKTDVSQYLALIGPDRATGQIEMAALTRGDWAVAGQSLFLSLLGGDRTLDFTELVIVPDGFLWYLPFETLCVDAGGRRRPLVALTDRPVRYAPTAALGLPVAGERDPNAGTLVLQGKLSAWQDLSVTRSAVTRMSEQVPGLQAVVPAQITRSPALSATFLQQLVVLAEIAPPGQGHDWVPLAGAKELPGSQLADWLRLPWGGPKRIVLPGSPTSAEEALRNGGDGLELFLPLTALQACGAETVVISRWQPGGRTVYDQIGAFLKNLSDETLTAAQAWQRASLQIAGSPLSAGEEPRIRGSAAEKAALDARANHPFFWGSLLFCDRGQE